MDSPPRPAPRARAAPGETGFRASLACPFFLVNAEHAMSESEATMRSEPQGSSTFARRALRVATYVLAAACACSPLAARAADRGENPWIAWVVLVGVALLVAGILLRAALGSETPPGWLSFIARRRQEGKPTTWREWPED